MEMNYICPGCGEVESFNSGKCPLCGSNFQRKAGTVDTRLKDILNNVSGIFDSAYEFAEDDEEKIYICEVEKDLYAYLKEKGLI